MQNFNEVYNFLEKNSLSSKFHNTEQLVNSVKKSFSTKAIETAKSNTEKSILCITPNSFGLIETGEQVVVGVNKFVETENSPLTAEKKGFMNPGMLRELSKNPLVTIGSHSKSHIPLTSCNQEELKIEISESKSYLEDLLGDEISMFSYPHGKFNSLVKDAVLKGGYKLAFTSHYDVNHLNQDKLALNRNEIWNTDNLQILKNKIAGDWDWLKYKFL